MRPEDVPVPYAAPSPPPRAVGPVDYSRSIKLRFKRGPRLLAETTFCIHGKCMWLSHGFSFEGKKVLPIIEPT